MDMIGEDMETDPVLELSSKEKAERLHALAIGPLASSVAKLSGSSRGIPTDKDFHFFNNFDEFKLPVKEIAEKSRAMLESIGSSRRLWGKEMIFPKDLDEGYDWLVNVNDEVFERFDVSVDEFQGVRKKEEESGRRVSSIDSESGFQLVYGKKKKSSSGVAEKVKGEVQDSTSAVKMALRDKRTTGSRPRVPFHLPTIPRPQDEFKILVNNSNYPFEHVWLRRSEDGSRFIHPLEELSELDFVDRSIGDVEPVKPLPIEITPFKLVQEVKDLKELAAKLRTVNEIAVDLEHNQYRSFQGLTCLMQISTRAEDFVVDTLKLRVHIGPYLREIFKDPSKKKVMHGADRDIIWLQRDFGIYVCNLFDTGQASKVLKLERNSLEYLLYYFCDVTANKEYQNADWRLRPLPDEMIRYAREDTHYLLYIYDLMRSRLLSESSESESAGDLLLEVYKRSYDVCMQLYEKELLTDSSYLHIYGLQASGFNAQQLAIVAGLCEWRDMVAREEDESTGYILPNKALLEIARQMPVTTSKLRRLLRSKHPYVEQNLGSVVNIIKHAIENSSAFEVAAEQLNKGHIEMEFEENTVVNNGTEAGTPEATTEIHTPSAVSEDIGDGNAESSKITENHAASVIVKDEPLELGNHTVECGVYGQRVSLEQPIEAGNMKNELDGCTSELPKQMLATSGRMGETMPDMSLPSLAKPVARASVQLLKKPSTFGALLGNSALQRRPGLDQKENTGKRMEQIKSSVNLPFNLFFSGYKQTESTGHTKFSAIPDTKESSSQSAAITKSEEIRPLESDLQNGESSDRNLDVAGDGSRIRDNGNSEEFGLEMDEGNELMSISDLTSSFQKCIKSTTQTKKGKQVEGSQESDGFLQVKPFDYAAAKKELNFGEKLTERDGGLRGAPNSDSRERRKSSTNGRAQIDEERRDLPMGRRRQAFPATGNRSATFR